MNASPKTHANIKCPTDGIIYSVNQGNYFSFPEKVKKYIESCQQKSSFEGGPFSLRYTGSMVADLHRNMLQGGIFLYPGTPKNSEGKLRLLYECNPFAFILGATGDMAVSDKENILEIKPDSLHQRIPFFAGSQDMINELRKTN